MSWGHVKPTQRGKPKTTRRQAQHGVEGSAPHRAEAFVAIQYEDAGKKANLHLQTSQKQTRGQADRPDAQTVDKATRYPNGDNRGKALRTTDQHHQTPRVGGPEGRAAAGEHQKNKKPGQTTGPDTEANQPTKGGKGKPARPRGDQTHKGRNNDKTKKPQRPTTEAKRKGKCHENRPRESHQGKTYQGTVNMSFEWKRGQTTSLNVRLTIETEEPNTAKSRIARGKSSPLRSETRQGGGKGRGGGGVVYAIRSIVLFW